ncbi:thermonuclease family protein [Chitinophaga sp. GCM10012297]|uniref:Thermonuclease family protein n=1 Tax=Chitinophaga chungangae TaxID=2821488 RepID=A0ABS3YL43_9BACT|nr:thermonuclease family protein [Chitinophaga chungangae]MBO9154973.1 thermonuclease family protein [Chitinophaga chungangae]
MRTLLIIIFALAGVMARAQTYTGKVTAVKDGDTIEMLVNGKPLRIRLYGVDSPEKGQPFGEKARQYTSRLCFGKVVKARKESHDQYGRTVAEVFLPDGSSLNMQLVQAGYAWQYTFYSKSEEMTAAQAAAKAARKGLWLDAHPVAPWEWRKQHRKAASR